MRSVWCLRRGGFKRWLRARMTAGVALTVALGLMPLSALADDAFSVPSQLRRQVDFWRDVFATYGKRQVIIHDSKRVDRIYRVLDFSELDGRDLSEVQVQLAMEKAVEREKRRIRKLLARLHRLGPNATNLTVEELRIRRLFKSDGSPGKFSHASAEDRVRAQSGLRERFADAIAVAHSYFPDMEEIFRREGVPPEITRLPLVESSFNTRARSKAGAVGMWQFMPATARGYLRVDDAVDERLDPISSTRAAARLLRQNYDRLGTWPLAIAAYNHGPGGIARAVRETGTTDIVAILQRYRGRSFKFASRNFYPEFLAALEVEQNHRRHFGALALRAPLETEVVRIPDYVALKSVVKCTGSDAGEIAELNPGLLPSVYAGKQRVPLGYDLRLPAGSRSHFESCYPSLPANQKFSEQRPLHVVHRVRRGQTLSQIARKYGSTVEQICSRNGLRNKNRIRVGQVLHIPTG